MQPAVLSGRQPEQVTQHLFGVLSQAFVAWRGEPDQEFTEASNAG